MLLSQTIQDNRGRIYGLLGDLQSLEYEAPSRLRFAFAVEAGYGLVHFKGVSWLCEDCAADGRRPEAGYVAGSRGLYFGDLGRDGKVFQRVCVAALGTDERHELLVGRTRGERVLDGCDSFRDVLEFKESGGNVSDFFGEVVGDGLVLE